MRKLVNQNQIVMRKFLFFALMALALAFTACDPNTPSNPGENNLKDYYGKWYLDSVNMGGWTTSHMQTIVEFIDDNTVLIGSQDSSSYEYKDNIVTINRGGYKQIFTVKSLDKNYAVLDGGDEGTEACLYYFSHLPAEDSGTEMEITEANMLGKYKYIYGGYAETRDGVTTNYYTFGMGMLMFLTLQENHRVLIEDNSTSQGYWGLDPAGKRFTWAQSSSYDDLMRDPNWQNIVKLTDNWLVLGMESETYDHAHRVYRDYYLRVK